MSLKSTIKKAVKSFTQEKEITSDGLYNYDTKEDRENTIGYLVIYADSQRSEQKAKWILYDEYYNNQHQAQEEIRKFCEDRGQVYIPAVVPDPYIHVESQINADIPDFEFAGRDNQTDQNKVKERQYVVQYVLDNNDMITKNSRNERRLNKFGDEIWKVGFDYNIEHPQNVHGDIFVHDIDPSCFINDPVATSIDDGEYHIYPYRLHRIKAARVFKNELDKLGIGIQEIGTSTTVETRIYTTQTYDISDDTVQIVEHWFRQPKAGKEKYTYNIDGKEITTTVEWESGDIACSILINDVEVKYIPKYWIKTSRQNKMYPFSQGFKIPNENGFWNKSEIEAIKDLVDATDREFMSMLMNDAYMSNDIYVHEEAALSDDTELDTSPGAVVKVKSGQINNVRRLGGLSTQNNGFKDTINFIRDIIKQTVGNFDVNMGDAPPGNVKTLGGLVEMKEQGNTRQNKKKPGTTAMWQRLMLLIDYTAIEFFDDNRLIYLGATEEQKPDAEQNPNNMDRTKGNVAFKFNSDSLQVLDDNYNNPQVYYPTVDCKINVGDGIKNSPAMTIQATENIASMNITPQNLKIVESLIDQMNLPNRKEIKQSLEYYFAKIEQAAQTAQPKEDKPNVSIAYKDLPIDAQVQILAQMGIQSQGGTQNTADVNMSMQGDMQPPELNIDDVMAGLSQEERQAIQDNPELLDELMGGQPNGTKMQGM